MEVYQLDLEMPVRKFDKIRFDQDQMRRGFEKLVLKIERMNDWDRRFFVSVYRGFKKYGRLTPKQRMTIRKIYKKYI